MDMLDARAVSNEKLTDVTHGKRMNRQQNRPRVHANQEGRTMKIPSVKAWREENSGELVVRKDTWAYGETDITPGRWYDEKTARLMERAVKLLVKPYYPGYWLDAARLAVRWAKLTEKKTEN
jgi:hypothetical protein